MQRKFDVCAPLLHKLGLRPTSGDGFRGPSHRYDSRPGTLILESKLGPNVCADCGDDVDRRTGWMLQKHRRERESSMDQIRPSMRTQFRPRTKELIYPFSCFDHTIA